MSDLLQRSVTGLKGVGEALRLHLERLGITTFGDLLHHYPRRYEDYSQLKRIRDVQLGAVTVAGTIDHIAGRRAVRRRLSITEAIINDGTGTLKCIWFNQPYLTKTLKVGMAVRISGKLEFQSSDLAIVSPLWERAEGAAVQTGRILPVYAETAGVTSKQLRALVRQVLAMLQSSDLTELLPENVRVAEGLLTLEAALHGIHEPADQEELEAAQTRLAFEELFMLQAASQLIKREVATETAQPITLDNGAAQQFVASLPFTLTDGQRAAAWKILQDISQSHPMNRLLEGDVGSGKTVVAAMAMTRVVQAGFQAALMVPTEILARQHASSLAKLLASQEISVNCLVSGMPAVERRAIEAQLASGEPGIVVGTQALLTDRVDIPKLALVIIDEQHRFGVKQRQLLKAKAGHLPHLLSMTATPIPRSLMLTVYGDLDVSIIRELPAGRKEIQTSVVLPKDRSSMYAAIDAELAAGRQAFIVCPLIEPSDVSGSKSVEAEFKRLDKTVFGHRRLAMLHGKLKPAEKEAIMQAFAAGDYDILIATTVVEVGVDVPNATVMLIEGAERFGLAALHQLRGRVGRGGHQAYCYLAPTDAEETGSARLAAMTRTTDGFRLAQLDLEQRGPGQIYGLAQHGVLDLRFAGLHNSELVARTREAAAGFVNDPKSMLQYPQTLARIESLRAVTSLD